jgi:hypothetical protein
MRSATCSGCETIAHARRGLVDFGSRDSVLFISPVHDRPMAEKASWRIAPDLLFLTLETVEG